MAEYLRTANGLEVIGGTNVYVEQMSQAEYDALPSATKDDNHFRVVVNPDGDEPGLQASEITTSTGSNVDDALNGNVFNIQYSATANMTYSQVIAWLESNVDKTKLTPNSRIDINGSIFTMSSVASTYFQMFMIGTIPNGVFVLSMRVGSSSQRAFEIEATTSGTTTADKLSTTAVITGGKIKVKY